MSFASPALCSSVTPFAATAALRAAIASGVPGSPTAMIRTRDAERRERARHDVAVAAIVAGAREDRDARDDPCA